MQRASIKSKTHFQSFCYRKLIRWWWASLQVVSRLRSSRNKKQIKKGLEQVQEKLKSEVTLSESRAEQIWNDWKRYIWQPFTVIKIWIIM